ncbi:hypothetical protein MSKU15_1394 [Komagataeibacter diospyri]|uniref:hypothetical protein n=1 Tax=Komagataeibacter diospyri TaxID=1932662 RepID=UPI00113D554B|nr:hypothetical protein [Komagataeibacter diospyri]GCE89793.1 hypothetical protein MSKU15_1394 [Komagataeibacter diospyri]
MLSSLFPEWMPAWAQAVLLVGGILFALVWLLVPFAVFGVKGRLDNLAIQLDDLQAELRVIAMGQQHAANAAASVAGDVLPDVVAPAPVWEPEPVHVPVRPAPDYDGVGDENDIPAYERRAARVQPAPPIRPVAPVRPQPRAEPIRPAEPVRAPPARHDIADEWDVLSSGRKGPRPYLSRAPERDGMDGRRERQDTPSLSDWSRNGPRDDDAGRGARPVRASVWPPERGSRAEPTLRWPPRPE